ncbi:hypothetical protein ABFS83_13G044600 [Erythranthe nasuta]
MDDSVNTDSVAEDEIKTSGDEGQENVENVEADEIKTGGDEGQENAENVEADEIKTGGDEGIENEEKVDEEVGPASIESFVEEFKKAEESVVENVTQTSSTYVTQVDREIKNLVADPWGILKKFVPEETLPTSDKSVGDSSEAANKSTSAEKNGEEDCVDENSRATHGQPLAAVAATSATSPASWMNCCGLLELLRPSDK